MESVEQLRDRLNIMKNEMVSDLEKKSRNKKNPSTAASIIDGSFLSVVFCVVLLLIICVSGYAFLNLYNAILKKFPTREHTEL